MENKNIVSVAVITYNSAETIIEALNSVSGQTYKGNIELVISDDCSTDNTVSIIKAWLAENEKYFYAVSLLEAKKNLGITGNLNKVIKHTRGKYIRLLAGDDMLYCDDTISCLVSKCKNKKGVFSTVEMFGEDNFSYLNIKSRKRFQAFINSSNENKLIKIIYGSRDLGNMMGGFFCEKEIYKNIGLYDDNYIMLEDYPFLIKIFESYHIDDFEYIDTPTIKYRVRKFNNEFLQSDRKRKHSIELAKYRKKKILPLLLKKRSYRLFLLLKVKMFLSFLERNSLFFARVVFL